MNDNKLVKIRKMLAVILLILFVLMVSQKAAQEYGLIILSDFMKGFCEGFFPSIIIVIIIVELYLTRILKDKGLLEEKLRIYDERQQLIKSKTLGACFVATLIFSYVIFVTMLFMKEYVAMFSVLAIIVFAIICKLGFKFYYSRKF